MSLVRLNWPFKKKKKTDNLYLIQNDHVKHFPDDPLGEKVHNSKTPEKFKAVVPLLGVNMHQGGCGCGA